MVAGARLWSRLVAIVAVIVAVSFRQVIRWQAEFDSAGPTDDRAYDLWVGGDLLECNPSMLA